VAVEVMCHTYLVSTGLELSVVNDPDQVTVPPFVVSAQLAGVAHVFVKKSVSELLPAVPTAVGAFASCAAAASIPD
jgi:hypothetical protein